MEQNKSLHINQASILIKSMPIDQAIQKIKAELSGQPETSVIKGELFVMLEIIRETHLID